jgi:hypothetical protein
VVNAPTKAKALDGLSVAETRMEQAFGDFQAQAGVSALAKQAHLVPMVQETPTVSNPGRIRNALTTFATILLGGIIVLLLVGPPRPAPGAGSHDDQLGSVGPPHATHSHAAQHHQSPYVARTRPTRGGRGGLTTARGPVSDFPIITPDREAGVVDQSNPPAELGLTGGTTQLEAAFDQAAAADKSTNHRTAAFDAASGVPTPDEVDDHAAWQQPAPHEPGDTTATTPPTDDTASS